MTREQSKSRARNAVFVLPSFRGGGAERVLLTYFAHLDPNRVEKRLLALSGDGPLAGLVPPGVAPAVLHRRRLRSAAFALYRALVRLRPDIVFSTMGHVNLALLAMKRLLPSRPRIVIRESNTPSRNLPHLAYSSLLRIGYKRLYSRADAIVCQSRLMADDLSRSYGVPPDLLSCVRNPVDGDALRRQAWPPIREPGPGIRCVAAGRLTRQKAFDRLLDLVAQAEGGLHVTILGDGELREDLKRRAESLDIAGKVRFAGFVDKPWPYYGGADAFLLTSRWEGMPNAALEALACGTPVIGTPESGGLPEVEASAPRAVTLAVAGPEFLSAVRSLEPAPLRNLRDSLLPHEFTLEAVMPEFERVLLGY